MMDSGAALDPDRLPWLADERKAGTRRGWGPVLAWALVAGLLIAGVSYWLGLRSTLDSGSAPLAERSRPEVTAALPPAETRPSEAVMTAPPPLAEPTPAPVAEAPPVTRPAPPVVRDADPEPAWGEAPDAEPQKTAEKGASTAAPAKKEEPLVAWPADVSSEAHGRVARIGTFSSRQQAKRGWSRIVRIYPGMRRLRAVVVDSPSLRNGKSFYRLQFGTTSQAHSEVLCQRMRIIGQSCAVVGVANLEAGMRR